MFRIIYSVILPFLVPFFVFFLQQKFSKTKKTLPLEKLVGIGLILSFLALFLFSDSQKASVDSVYTPPRYINGKIEPAKMKAE